MSTVERVSAIILAGGAGSRMGRAKAGLELHGISFLTYQIRKLHALGLRDVLVSGEAAPGESARAVADVYPQRGPLGGIHAGLLAIENESALVLAVDTPLIPGDFLLELIERHQSGVTLAALGGVPEPLIGVYDKSLAEKCGEILRGENTAIRRLLRYAVCSLVEYTGDPAPI